MLKMSKGSKLKMQKADGSAINAVRLELGWRPQTFASGHKHDLDVSAIALVDNGDAQYPFGKGHSEEFVLFYNSETRTTDGVTTFLDGGLPKKGKPTTPNCAMIHQGDSRDGANVGGDEKQPDEVLNVFFDRLPQEVNVVHIIVTIDEAQARGQNFGQVRDSWIKVYNNDTNECLASYDLEDDAPTATALLFVELRKKNDVWSVNAVNQGYPKGLSEFLNLYGFATE